MGAALFNIEVQSPPPSNLGFLLIILSGSFCEVVSYIVSLISTFQMSGSSISCFLLDVPHDAVAGAVHVHRLTHGRIMSSPPILQNYSILSPTSHTVRISTPLILHELTNIVGLGIKGLINSHRLGEKGWGPRLPYITLINLGIASSIFHSSLKYSTQMCDEFSMLIATFVVCYRLMSLSQTRFSQKTIAISLITLMGIVMIAQFGTGESTVQQVVFTVMVYWLSHMCYKLTGTLENKDGLRVKLRWMALSAVGE